MDEKLMTVKEYADEQHVSRQSVNSKINCHKEELKDHIFTVNGRKVIDRFAQVFLKPTKCNVLLIGKNAIIAEKDKRIAVLTDKAAAFEIFAERLDKSFTVFEDNANIGIVQKVASGLFGRK